MWICFVFFDGPRSQIEYFVPDQSIAFSLVNICFLISLISLNLDFNISLKQLTRVSVVNLSSKEKRSDKEVNFSLLKSLAADQM